MRYLTILFLILIGFGFSNNPSRSGIEIYSVEKEFKNSIKDCKYCFNEKSVILSKSPILKENDIKIFNWDSQQIILTESGKQKISKLKIDLAGLPVVMVLNGERIYGFWFWNSFSSFGCDRVYAYPQSGFKIEFGLPTNNTFGNDPRFNKVLEKYVVNRFKQN